MGGGAPGQTFACGLAGFPVGIIESLNVSSNACTSNLTSGCVARDRLLVQAKVGVVCVLVSIVHESIREP